MLRVTITGGGLIAVTYGLARFALGLFTPEFRATFDMTATGIGWVMAGSFGGYLGALALAGPAVSRGGARSVAVASGVLATAGLLGVATAPGTMLLGLAATIGGASTGLASPALAATVERHFRPANRPTAQTAINAGTSVGLIVAAPAALVTAQHWRAAWLLFAGLALIAVLAATRLLPVTASTTAPVAPEIESRRLDHRLRWSAVLLGLSSATYWGFGRELLEVIGGLDPGASRSAWIAVGAGGLLGGAAGSLARRYGLRRALTLSWVTFAAAYAGLAAVPITATAFVLTAAFGAAYMALTGLLIVWSVGNRQQQPGSAVASVFLVLAAGQIIGSPLAGLAVDLLGYREAFALAAVVAMGGIVSLPDRRGGIGSSVGAAAPGVRRDRRRQRAARLRLRLDASPAANSSLSRATGRLGAVANALPSVHRAGARKVRPHVS